MMRDASRRVVAPRGIDVPARLPGGVWGAPPFAYSLKFTANGTPTVSFGGPASSAVNGVDVPADIAAAAASRAEQPWPQVWALRVGVTASVAAQQFIQPPIETEFELEMSVESSTFRWLFPVPFVGESSTLFPQSESPANIVAQVVSIRPRRVRPIPPNILYAGYDTTLTFTWLLGLVAPPQRVAP